MTVTPEGGIDTRLLLLGDPDEDAAFRRQVDQVLEQPEAGLACLAAAAHSSVRAEVARLVENCLSTDLLGLAGEGWRLHQQLVKAAQETAATPGLTLVVDALQHKVVRTEKPTVQVVMAGQTLCELAVEVQLALVLAGLSATVTGGRVTAVGGCRCTLSGTVSLGGREVLTRKRAITLAEHELSEPVVLAAPAVPRQEAPTADVPLPPRTAPR